MSSFDKVSEFSFKSPSMSRQSILKTSLNRARFANEAFARYVRIIRAENAPFTSSQERREQILVLVLETKFESQISPGKKMSDPEFADHLISFIAKLPRKN